jgi:hypothetical protein
MNTLRFLTFWKKTFQKNPDKYEIVHIYRYEGDSNPDDEAIVFIKSKSGKKKGLCCKLSFWSSSSANQTEHTK